MLFRQAIDIAGNVTMKGLWWAATKSRFVLPQKKHSARYLTQNRRQSRAILNWRILSATCEKPSDGSTHWSCRKLATALGVSKDAVQRIWKEAGLKPHRLERYLASDDPEFESKAADIIGLYLRPPQHACRVLHR